MKFVFKTLVTNHKLNIGHGLSLYFTHIDVLKVQNHQHLSRFSVLKLTICWATLSF